MGASDALGFLRKLAGTERVDANPEAATEIVQLCGRLFFALRIAGRRRQAGPTWRLNWLAERLTDERPTVEELKVEDLEDELCVIGICKRRLLNSFAA